MDLILAWNNVIYGSLKLRMNYVSIIIPKQAVIWCMVMKVLLTVILRILPLENKWPSVDL